MESTLVKVLSLVVIIGAVNWLVYALDGGEGLVKRVLGNQEEKVSKEEKFVYVLVGLAGLALVYFKVMQGQNKLASAMGGY